MSILWAGLEFGLTVSDHVGFTSEEDCAERGSEVWESSSQT